MQRRLNSKSSQEPLPWLPRGFGIAALTFHGFVFAYTWLRIQPALGYVHSGPLFFLDHSFFRGFLEYPGGLLDYAAAGLAQFNGTNLSGALNFTGLAGLCFLATVLAWRRIGGSPGGMVPFVPPFLLLLTHQRNDGGALGIGLGFVGGLGLALACERLCGSRTWVRVAVCALGGPLIFGVAGLWPCLLFLLATATWEVRLRRWPTGTAALLLGLSTSGALAGLAGGSLQRILNPWDSGMSLGLAVTIYLFVPLAMLGFSFFPQRVLGGTHAHAAPDAARKNSHAVAWIRPSGWRRMTAMLACGAGLVWLWAAFDMRNRTVLEIEYAASLGENSRVVAAATRLERLPPAAEVRLHLALWHTGELLSDLFRFTNMVACELLPDVKAGPDATRAQAVTLFELGQVNEAEHLAHEALEFAGDRPDLLKLLANVNVLKDRPAAARVFLNVLRQSPVHRAGATARLRELEADPRLAGDQKLSLIRSRLVTTDLPHDGMPTAIFLEQLLHSNPRNQMAFEYLLAHRLLTLDLERFAAKVGQLREFGYTRLPRHCEEAVLLHQRLRGTEVDLCGNQISSETLQRFQALCRAIDRGEQRTAEGARALSREFGNTYWYYFLSWAPAGRLANQSAPP